MRIGGPALLLAIAVHVAPAWPLDVGPRGGVIVTGSGSGYYDGGEMDDLAQTVLTTLFVLISDEEDEWCTDHYHHRYLEADQLEFSIPKAQYDLGVGTVVTSDLTVGVRVLLRQDLRDDPVAMLLGIGPEATYFYREAGSAVRPYLGAGVYSTRGVSRFPNTPVSRGTTVDVRAGVSVRVSDTMGYTLHTAYQRDRLQPEVGDPVTAKSVGVGLGLTAYLE